MKRARSYRKAAVVGMLVVAGFLVLGACSNQSEGDRCESLNGNDDCQSPLVCTTAAQLTGTTSDRCCPQDRSQATAAVCKQPISSAGPDAAPDGTGPTIDASNEAGDASSDASDGGSDASDAADAPTDG